MAAQVLLDLGGPRRRVDGHRNPAREQHPEKTEEVIAAGGKHDDHCLARLELPLPEPRRHALRAVPERAVSDRLALSLVGVEAHVGPLGMRPDVPVEDFDQGAGAPRHRLGHAHLDYAHVRGRGGALPGPRAQHRTHEIPWRLGAGHQVLRQRHVEGVLEPGQKLHAREAVKAQVLVERAVQPDPAGRRVVRAQLGR